MKTSDLLKRVGTGLVLVGALGLAACTGNSNIKLSPYVTPYNANKIEIPQEGRCNTYAESDDSFGKSHIICRIPNSEYATHDVMRGLHDSRTKTYELYRAPFGIPERNTVFRELKLKEGDYEAGDQDRNRILTPYEIIGAIQSKYGKDVKGYEYDSRKGTRLLK